MLEPTEHCPYLGLKQNRAIRFASPTPEHRCYATGQAQEIPPHLPNYQRTFCLSSDHVRCPLYTGLGMPSTPVTSPSLPLRPILVSTGGLRGWLAGLSARDRAIYSLLLAFLAAILAIYTIAGVGLIREGGLVGNSSRPHIPASPDGPGIGQLTPQPSASPTMTPSATPSPSATPTETPLPTIEAVSPTPEPPTATFAPPIYIPPPPPTPTATGEPIPSETPTPEPIAPTPSETPEVPVAPTTPEAPTEPPVATPTAETPPVETAAPPSPILPLTPTEGPPPPPARTPEPRDALH